MNTDTALTTSWPAILGVFRGIVDLDGTAREHKAFQRGRQIKSAADLLRLALAYGGGLGSYRTLSAWALAIGLANMSDVAILKRLHAAADWLVFLAGHLLATLVAVPAGVTLNRPIRIVDASCISKPGSKGTDFRLHAVYDPARQCFTQCDLTDDKGGEKLTRFVIEKNDIWLADRGYNSVDGLRHVVDAGADFVVRIGWRALVLRKPDNTRFTVTDALKTAQDHLDLCLVAEAQTAGRTRVPLRLVAMRKSPQAAEKDRRRIRKDAQRKGKTIDPRTLQAAGWIILVTSLDANTVSRDQLFALYRVRWQIEIGFKRLKSLNLLDRLPAKQTASGRSWIAANLILAILISRQYQSYLDSPPCARYRV